MKIENNKSSFILASASPRRKQLLTDAGYKFTVVVSQIDESVFPTENITSVEYAKQLAFAKANDVAQNHPDSIVIGADTVVDFEGQIIGKPRDAKHAEEITRMLFSRPHKVITGIAIICKARNLKIVEAERRPGDPASLVAKADKIRLLTGWEPRFNNLETIVADAWRWESGLMGR